MDTENQNQGESTSGDTYITYEVGLEDVQALLEQQNDTLELIEQRLTDLDKDLIDGVGVMGALFGFLIGFAVFKELLKVWLE